MSLTKLTDNLNVVQGLADKPTQTASQLKEVFDSAGNTIKDYINNTLTTEIDTSLETKANSSDVNTSLNNLIKTEDVVITYNWEDPGKEGMIIKPNCGIITIPSGYKVLTANTVNIEYRSVGQILSTISQIVYDEYMDKDVVWIKTLGPANGFDVDITVRMVYIKE